MTWKRGLAVIAVLVIGLAILVLARPSTFWNLDGTDLADSIGGETHGELQMLRACRERSAGVWTCAIDHDPGSGAPSTSRVTVDDDRCWVAETPNEPRLTGCVGFVDYLSLPDFGL